MLAGYRGDGRNSHETALSSRRPFLYHNYWHLVSTCWRSSRDVPDVEEVCCWRSPVCTWCSSSATLVVQVEGRWDFCWNSRRVEWRLQVDGHNDSQRDIALSTHRRTLSEEQNSPSFSRDSPAYGSKHRLVISSCELNMQFCKIRSLRSHNLYNCDGGQYAKKISFVCGYSSKTLSRKLCSIHV